MTREEKVQKLTDLINITGNTTKLIRFILVQAAQNLPAEDESKIDEIIAILELE